MSNPWNNRTKIAKAALAAKLGHRNVSVTQGKGTAAAWLHIKVKLTRPAKYHHYETCQEPGRCFECREQTRRTHAYGNAIERIAAKALADNGSEFSRFSSDDGYDTSHACVSTRIEWQDTAHA